MSRSEASQPVEPIQQAEPAHPAWVAYEPDLVPSLERMRTEGIEVLEEWFRWGEEWSMLLRVYGGITRTSAVLEIGCGQGRIAFPLRYLLSSGGSYDGFDIDRDKIAFDAQAFGRAHPNFRFQYVDVHNSFYNPAGRLRGDSFRFPYSDGSFDIVFAASVFTHMAPEVAANYLREAARVLKPGGRFIFSVFLLDHYRPGATRSLGFTHPRFNFDHPYGAFDQREFAIANPNNPEEMTACSQRLLERLAADAGLKRRQPIVPGQWSGSIPTWVGAQDLIVLERAGGFGSRLFRKSQVAKAPEPPVATQESRPSIEQSSSATPQEAPDVIEGWAPGHFYSPIPSLREVRSREGRLFGPAPAAVAAVDLNEAAQVALFKELTRYYAEQPFTEHNTPSRRFFFDNPNFSYGEAVILYSMMRHYRPKRVIEVGSGYSSCTVLDTNELFLDNSVACTFIEPYPDLLLSLLKPADRERIRLLPTQLQDVDLAEFAALSSGDFLIVDSTHVSKVGSDVHRIFFEILPILAPGVHVHVHDIYYPFEYPKAWVYGGRAWNETYLMRAFLQYVGSPGTELEFAL